jgi:hypothetical protein
MISKEKEETNQLGFPKDEDINQVWISMMKQTCGGQNSALASSTRCNH